jgi:hypothetical protein
MDEITLKICDSNPDIDAAAELLVRLLASRKGQLQYGKVGVLAEMKVGGIAYLHRIEEETTKLTT